MTVVAKNNSEIKFIDSCSAKLSTNSVKVISKADILAVNKKMKTLTRQNAKERLASEKSATGSVFGGKIDV